MVVAGAVLFQFSPEKTNWYPVCLFTRFTSLDCPGCGSLRSAHHLLHGQISRAADHNILFVLLLPIIAIGTLSTVYPVAAKCWNYLNKPRWIFMLILIFWIVRNIHHEPFIYLHSNTYATR
jgi:uncharacterized membrane protein YhaH (DUF805 family)